MDQSIYIISYVDLAWVIGLILIVIAIYVKWSLDAATVIYATSRMLLQLLLIGYILNYIFQSNNPVIICCVLSLMLSFAGYIALRPVKIKTKSLYLKAFYSISISGLLTLFIVTQLVVHLTPWFEPHFIIPLAGMIFANAMNTVSLAAERFEMEMIKGGNYHDIRAVALHTSLIPITNSFFAAGLVSLPGMMTGQILSGMSPIIAAQYQIMVMCMIFGSGGIASILYLTSIKNMELLYNPVISE